METNEHNMMNCHNKKRYPTEKMADKYANEYNSDSFIKEDDFLMSYYCEYHNGWHVGHKEQKTLTSYTRVQRLLDKIKRNKYK